jgi:uncharacterized membrane protein YdjX (TVP38/TMEM64 family)
MIEAQELGKRFLLLMIIIGCWILIIIHFAKSLPELFLPHSIQDLKQIQSILRDYSQNQSGEMFSLFCFVFLFKQTFGIPGALILNILAGSMYGLWGLPLVCSLAAIGSSFMYQISKHLLGHIVFGNVISKQSVNTMKAHVDENKDHLMLFMIITRTLPILPGWLINLTAPFVGVPLHTFAAATWLGSIPYAFVCIQAAATLSSINSARDIFSFWVIFKLLLLVLVIIIPVLLKNRILGWLQSDKGYRKTAGEALV